MGGERIKSDQPSLYSGYCIGCRLNWIDVWGIQPIQQAGALWKKAFITDGKARTKALYYFARKAMQPVAIWVLPKPFD
ncbi:Uncharacterised protein [Ectopseudomonas oleovorans]|uniref:Uncharacterized protein n=1 Tax=Ectopseudomonas oleovorans TaxID=301 RepID=A0A379JZF6_ECTOL|nr:Uncharacterised protein [Pseudomonas oleovorans]